MSDAIAGWRGPDFSQGIETSLSLPPTKVRGTLPAGSHTINWDGKNKEGEDVSSGIYYYRFEANDRAITKKMVVIR